MRKGARLFVAIVVIATGSIHAQPRTILFNPLGNPFGGSARGPGQPTKAVDSMDVFPGNALLIGINANTTVGSVASLLFQANLVNATLAGSPVFWFGSSGLPAFTIVAQFTVKVIGNSGGTLAFAPPGQFGTQGLVRIYRHSSNAANLSGTCFASDCGGHSVLEGRVDNQHNFNSILVLNVSTPAQVLDQNGSNDQPSVTSLRGVGSLVFDIVVFGVDSFYFPNLPVGRSPIYVHATVQLSVPFILVDPSACFSADAITGCNRAGVSSVGTVNGQGANTILQADASLSFR